MLFLIAVFLFILSLTVEAWLVYSYIRSSCGRYPPYFPSFGQMKKAALQQAGEILKHSPRCLKVIDLGCGDGRMLRPLAKQFREHSFQGYEWSWFPYKLACWFGRSCGNLEYIHADFMTQNLSAANLILCFLGNEIAPELSLKLKKELKPGSIIISSAFALQDLTLLQEITTRNYLFLPIKVFIYQV